jgi:hypothetical protein
MNTLSRAITARFFPNLDSYNALRNHWSDLTNSEGKYQLTAAHHLLYLALMGKDWRKAFTPVINRRKLENGAFWNWGMFHALQAIHLKSKEEDLLAPFNGLITPQIMNEVRNLLPTGNVYAYKPSDFVVGAYPFDAYIEQNTVNAMIHIKEGNANG